MAPKRLSVPPRTYVAATTDGAEEAVTRIEQQPRPAAVPALTGIGVAIGVVVAMLTSDVILGVIAGASFIAVAVGLVRLWVGSGTQRPRHT
jgi:hypothetical protein